ncbi:MAG: PAS domain S-box protein [Rhizomicrobium sp.]|nr:PAS domain S-box protein [Rhizomicrobium sp.]
MTALWIFRTRGTAAQARAFALGFIAVALTLALRVYLRDQVEAASLIFFVPAILLASATGGLWAGVFTTLLSGAGSAYFLLAPKNSFEVSSPFALMTLSVLAVTGLFIAAICELLRQTIRLSEDANSALVLAHKEAEQLAAIVEGSSDAIIGKTVDGIITSWNKSSANIFGYSAAEMIGAHVSTLIPSHLHAEEEVIRAEIATGNLVSPFETCRLRKDGTSIDVSIAISPVYDAQGGIVGASTAMRDITRRKRAEREIHSTRATLEAALSCMTDAVLICDAEGNFIHSNEAFATFHKFDGAERFKSLEQYSALVEALTSNGQSVPFEEGPISRALKGEIGLTELTLRRKDTGESWIASINFAPIIGEDGVVEGAVLTERDITEQRTAEARLESMRGDLARVGRLNEMGQISAGLAHELNQPLAAMLNYSNVARRLIAQGGPLALEKASDAIAKSADQAVRAGEIIRRMRAFIEKRETSRRIVSINAVVEDAMAVGLTGGAAESITIRMDLSAETHFVNADPIQIQQVVVNLLRNAVDAMEGAVTRVLTISTKAIEDKTIEVAVRDTGSGISREIANILFMPFVTSKPSGMGIGLVISQSIIEAHGGRITFESSPESGTVFHFRLPAATSPPHV